MTEPGYRVLAWQRLAPWVPPVWQLPLAVFLSSFALYAIWATGGTSWMDSGELGHAAFLLGGAHPPGHVGHTLLGRLVVLLPIGEVAFRVTLLSAASMAAAAALVIVLARELVGRHDLAATFAAIVFAVSPSALFNATRTEVYGPALALIAVAVIAVVRYTRRRGDGRAILLAALLCALAAMFHLVLAVTAAVAMAIAVLAAQPRQAVRLALPCLVLVGCAALLLLYLPVRGFASSPPLFLWGDPTTVDSFVRHVTASVYQGNFGVSGLGGRLSVVGSLIAEGGGVVLILAGLVGLGLGALTGLGGAGVVLGAAVLFVVGPTLQESFNPDLRGYLLPAVWLTAAGVPVLVAALSRMIGWNDGQARVSLVEVCGLLPLAIFFAMTVGSRAPDAAPVRTDDPLRLWDETVGVVPPGPAVYFATGDHSLFAAQYERLVAGARPDVAIASPGLARDRWFLAHIKRMLPELRVPFIDDGEKGQTAERLAIDNVRSGRIAAGDAPAFGELLPGYAVPLGRGFRYQLAEAGERDDEVLPPLVLRGGVGPRAALALAMERARYESLRDHLAAAARALGLDGTRFDETAMARLAAGRDLRPSLVEVIPRISMVFIAEPWQPQLFGDDLAWRAGLAVDSPVMPQPEARLHSALRGTLDPDQYPDEVSVDSLDGELMATLGILLTKLDSPRGEAVLARRLELHGDDERVLVALASMFANRQQLTEAEPLLQRAAAISVTAETHARLGVVLARLGRMDEAKSSWRRALELDPTRKDVAGWLDGR